MLRTTVAAALLPLASALGSVVFKNSGCQYILWTYEIDNVLTAPDTVRSFDEWSVPFSLAQKNKTMVFSVWPAEGSDKKRQITDSYNYNDFEVILSEDNTKVTYGFLPGFTDIFAQFGYTWEFGSTDANAKKCNSLDDCSGIEASADSDIVFSGCTSPDEGQINGPEDGSGDYATNTQDYPLTYTTLDSPETTAASYSVETTPASYPTSSPATVIDTTVDSSTPVSVPSAPSATYAPSAPIATAPSASIPASAMPSYPATNGTGISSPSPPSPAPIATGAASTIHGSIIAVAGVLAAVALR